MFWLVFQERDMKANFKMLMALASDEVAAVHGRQAPFEVTDSGLLRTD
jgi:hypothetical protein